MANSQKVNSSFPKRNTVTRIFSFFFFFFFFFFFSLFIFEILLYAVKFALNLNGTKQYLQGILTFIHWRHLFNQTNFKLGITTPISIHKSSSIH